MLEWKHPQRTGDGLVSPSVGISTPDFLDPPPVIKEPGTQTECCDDAYFSQEQLSIEQKQDPSIVPLFDLVVQ